MTRKPPYEHKVTDYTRRDGKHVETYRRGSGSKPRTRTRKKTAMGGSAYSVTLYYASGSETHPVQSDSLYGASYKGLQSLEAAEVPRKMRIKVN